MEIRSGFQGILYLNHTRTEVFAHLLHDVFEIGFFTIHLVKTENNRLLEFCRGSENIFRSNFNAILRIYKDKTHVADSKSRVCVTYEIIGTGAIDDIKFLTVEFSIEYS